MDLTQTPDRAHSQERRLSVSCCVVSLVLVLGKGDRLIRMFTYLMRLSSS